MAFEKVENVVELPQKDEQILAKIVAGLLSISALAQRFTIALSNLFAMLAIASVWGLFMAIPNPTAYQLFALGGYSVFVLVALYIVRRR